MPINLDRLTTKQQDNGFIKILLIITLASSLLAGILVSINFIQSQSKARTLAAKAQDHFRQQNLDKAEAEIEEALKYNKCAKNYFIEAQILAGQGFLNEASEAVSEALKKEPQNDKYLFLSGQLHSSLGQHKEALELFTTANKLAPKVIEYKKGIGDEYLSLREFDKAAIIYEEILKLEPKDRDYWINLAVVYNRQEKLDKGLEVKLRALDKLPDDAYLWYQVGAQYVVMKNTKEATQAFQKALELDPNIGGEEIIAAIENGSLYNDSSKQKAERKEYVIPVHFYQGHALIDVKINGYRGAFLVDTGASDTCIFQDFLTKYELKFPKSAFLTQYQTAGGLISVPVTYADLKIGDLSLKSHKMAILKSAPFTNINGIIGMSVLQKYNMQIDNSKHVLRLSSK